MPIPEVERSIGFVESVTKKKVVLVANDREKDAAETAAFCARVKGPDFDGDGADIWEYDGHRLHLDDLCGPLRPFEVPHCPLARDRIETALEWIREAFGLRMKTPPKKGDLGQELAIDFLKWAKEAALTRLLDPAPTEELASGR